MKAVGKASDKKQTSRKFQDHTWAYIMIAPTIIGLIILNIWPLIQTVILSFNTVDGFNQMQWSGLTNFKKLFDDPEVWQATWNTLKYTIISVPIGVILSLVVAVLLNANIKGKTIYRVIYFLPVVSAPAAIAMVWKWLYNSDYGLFNYILSLVGIHGPKWLSDPKIALLSIIVVGIWSVLGYNMIILLAGLQEIPKTFYEAAEIDGAGPIRRFFAITFPLVSPTMFFVVITSIIGGLQIFDLIFMMIDRTNGALQSTESLVYLFYKYSFVMNDKGYGSAIVTLLLVIILAITVVQLKLQKKWVHYD
ncbi:carbohydrate ABC transporter permease [Clostridium pasteurianum]|uniref:Permease component of ABC-type sugar transporter n=1 Tax=Clostridium pasteurianum BC1 TaxID=86416 RepID=R4K7W9_CLOPA|nr:sugar ABC transporter permease [Clostridium pasteurianum]AGK95740.1 permease component of ABC-type sugar transporter [Clostridium pasteurianum BC1]